MLTGTRQKNHSDRVEILVRYINDGFALSRVRRSAIALAKKVALPETGATHPCILVNVTKSSNPKTSNRSPVVENTTDFLWEPVVGTILLSTFVRTVDVNARVGGVHFFRVFERA